MGKRFYTQPLIRGMKAVSESMDWITITRPLEDEKFL